MTKHRLFILAFASIYVFCLAHAVVCLSLITGLRYTVTWWLSVMGACFSVLLIYKAAYWYQRARIADAAEKFAKQQRDLDRFPQLVAYYAALTHPEATAAAQLVPDDCVCTTLRILDWSPRIGGQERYRRYYRHLVN